VRPLPLLVLIAVTSVIAWAIGVFVLRLPRPGLRRALGLTLEIVGFGVVFVAVNVVITMTTALVLRRVSGFVSLYASNDIVLLLFSLMQGAVFATWRHLAGRDRDR
jgi:hypothetical protein